MAVKTFIGSMESAGPFTDLCWEENAMPEIRRLAHGHGATEDEIKAGVVADEEIDGNQCRVIRIVMQNPKEPLDTPIADLGMKPYVLKRIKLIRTENGRDIKTLGDLIQVSTKELITTPMIGRKTYRSICYAVYEQGFDPWPAYKTPKPPKPRELKYNRSFPVKTIVYGTDTIWRHQ